MFTTRSVCYRPGMLQIIEFTAVVTSAVYGVLLASQKKLDAIGVIAVAFVVAFGGGTLRDLFLNRHPLYWISHPYLSMLVFAIGIVGSFVPAWFGKVQRLLPLPDAVGLGLLSMTGVAIAMEQGTAPFIAALLGTITGTFGGVLGDVICNEIPALFRPVPALYATCAFTGAWVYLILRWCGVPENAALLVGAATITLFRLAALHWKLCLPAIHRD